MTRTFTSPTMPAPTHSPSQSDKGTAFRAMHERESAFIIPNPWDVGSARMLASLGFEALASTSAGYAFSIGKLDNKVGRDAMLRHVAELVAGTDLPVSADLENGFGDAPEAVVETFTGAAKAGLVGGSIEDSTGRADAPLYDLSLAVERVRAAVETVRALPFTFTLTARAENYLVGRQDLGDTIKRLQAYQDAGADVLYAPGLTRMEDVAAVVSSLDRPVNVLAGMGGARFSLAELSAAGVKRISLGGALARAALGAFLRAANELREHGTFTFLGEAATMRQVADLLGPWAERKES
jgi:2-methylisocitrate lyase-like PEP mutase family enzyme